MFTYILCITVYTVYTVYNVLQVYAGPWLLVDVPGRLLATPDKVNIDSVLPL